MLITFISPATSITPTSLPFSVIKKRAYAILQISFLNQEKQI